MFNRRREDKPPTIYQVVKFEISPDDDQQIVLGIVSENLRGIWNEALSEISAVYEKYHKPVYEEILEAKKNEDEEEILRLQEKLKEARKEHPLPNYVAQQNALTPRRAEDESFAAIPRAFQEDALVTLHASFKSFFELRKKGDPDARPPKMRDKENSFYEISGRSVSVKEGQFNLRLRELKKTMSFSIPQFQRWKLEGRSVERLQFPAEETEDGATIYRRFHLLGKSQEVKIKKFTLFRTPKDITQSGRFWVSLAYDIAKPDLRPVTESNTVFLALGASAIGVHSARGDRVIKLARSDKHWKPKIEKVEARIKKAQKGSRKWRTLTNARRKMFRLMQAQQKLHQREITAKLLRLGTHFVVTELVVRSKPGKLADGTKPERGGSLGPNWAAQNTGNIAGIVSWLTGKAIERGGKVIKLELPGTLGQHPENQDERKIALARILAEHYRARVREA